jgi:endonuclease/exonuclease/phosphatase family metal-dependent hydrolase
MDMSFARVASGLAVLTALCACSGRGDTGGPLLPIVDLPSTTVGLAYEVHLTATGGVPPLRYSVGDVPPGFSFYSGTALFTGPATAEGDYTLTVGVTDAAGATDSRSYALRVYAAPAITTSALPQATSGLAYEFLLSATGGQPPLRWSLADGSLPPGLRLSVDGTVSGTPNGLGSYPFTARVQDANGAQATRQFSVMMRNSTTDGGTPDEGTFPLQVSNWNIEFFGATGAGPTDEQLQLTNARTVITNTNSDLWGLEEIVDVNHFNALKDSLPGYAGFLANDPQYVPNGASYYSSTEQKLGVLFKADVVQVLSAELILTESNSVFAGRPPLRVNLRVTRNEMSVDLVAIVVHLKASADAASYNQRVQSAGILKTYLDTALPTARVIVFGDWNDDVDNSIVSGQPTPFQNFLDAPAEYSFLTQPLSSTSSTVSLPGFIDHQLVTNELAANYVSSSAMVVRPAITNYGETTSDHYPVTSRFDFGEVTPGPTSPVFINEFLPQPNNNPSTGQPDFDQQFVEIVNTGSTPADLGGWKLHDAESYSGTKPARHVFAAGTTLAPGKAYVVYSGANAVPGGGTNVDYANGNDGLRLNRGVNVGSSGDTLYLVKPDSSVVDTHYYRDTFQGISYNRSPDVSVTGTWVLHNSLSSGLSASPGRRADGTSF